MKKYKNVQLPVQQKKSRDSKLALLQQVFKSNT